MLTLVEYYLNYISKLEFSFSKKMLKSPTYIFNTFVVTLDQSTSWTLSDWCYTPMVRSVPATTDAAQSDFLMHPFPILPSAGALC